MSDLFNMDGRRVLVTGASRGIGRAIALAMGRHGAKVAVHYNTASDQAEEVASTIRQSGSEAFTIQADIRNRQNLEVMARQIFDRWGGLDVLVNNAGDMVCRTPLEAADESLVEDVLDLNLTSCVGLVRRFITMLKEGRDPAIVNMTSISAYSGGQGGVSLYAAAKAGVIGLTRSLARELAPVIRVNAVAPGVIETDLHRRLSTPETLADIAHRTPLARNGDATEVAGAVLLLATPAGSFITGEVIHVNGGLWMA